MFFKKTFLTRLELGIQVPICYVSFLLLNFCCVVILSLGKMASDESAVTVLRNDINGLLDSCAGAALELTGVTKALFLSRFTLSLNTFELRKALKGMMKSAKKVTSFSQYLFL